MSIDLRAFDATGTWTNITNKDMTGSLPLSPPTTGLEVLTGKVVKYLLTYKGTDALNPLYGGTAMHYQQMAEVYVPTVRNELLDDIRNCISFIRQTETGTTEHRIADIELVNLEYGYTDGKFQMHVHIIVTDTDGNQEPIEL